MKLFRRGARPDRAASGDRDVPIEVIVELGERPSAIFVCPECGRTDLPPVGDWDPPICEECDAAINFDRIDEVEFDPF